MTQHPTVGRIISLDSDSGSGDHPLVGNEDEEEEEDEDSVLVKLDDKPAPKPSKPSKPAPPKPRVPRFSRPPPPAVVKKKTSPTAAVTRVSSSGDISPTQMSPLHPSVSPPPPLSTSSAPDVMPHIIDSSTRITSQPPPKPPR